MAGQPIGQTSEAMHMNVRAMNLVRRLGEIRNRGRFSEILAMASAQTPTFRIDDDGTCAVDDYAVPARLTVNGRLCVSSCAALFDEVSSFGVIAADRSHRWGVSVALSATRTGLMPATGERVSVVSKNVRLGRSLGSCDVALVDAATGAVLATGTHTKFLPNGIPGWDAVVGGPLKPLIIAGGERRARRLGDRPRLDLSRHGALADAVPLAFDPRDRRRAVLEPATELSNAMGTLHGGSLVIASHRVARRAAAARSSARSLHCEFLATGAGPHAVTATRASLRVTDVAITAANGKRVFRAQALWD